MIDHFLTLERPWDGSYSFMVWSTPLLLPVPTANSRPTPRMKMWSYLKTHLRRDLKNLSNFWKKKNHTSIHALEIQEWVHQTGRSHVGMVSDPHQLIHQEQWEHVTLTLVLLLSFELQKAKVAHLKPDNVAFSHQLLVSHFIRLILETLLLSEFFLVSL